MNETVIQYLKIFNGILDNLIARHRMLFIVGSHLGVVAFANIFSFFLRFEGIIPPEFQVACVRMLPILLLIYMIALWSFGLFHGLWRYVGFHDLVRIVWACFIGALAFFLFVHGLLQVTSYPRSTIILTGLLSASFLGGVRLTFRWFREWVQRVGTTGRRVLLVGAGDAGELLLRDLQSSLAHNYFPVAFVDDARTKQKSRIHGIPVAGKIEDIPDVAKQYQVEEIIIAIPSASPQIRQRILFACEPCPLPIKTLPDVQALLNSPVSFQGVHSFTLEDLLQREPVQTALEELHPLLYGKRVLVTGAGGSIGSELCRQISGYQPSLLLLFERHENSLYSLDLELREKFPKLNVVAVVGDVTVSGCVGEIFSRYSPELVFHAAAHKHVPLMESNAIEAVRNNVLGTKVVCEMAMAHEVEQFVLISTDKAINPTSVMGATKWVAEGVIQASNKKTGCRFNAVRFGNVLGSNGSVVPLFAEQIKKGGPVTVTHQDIKRYFMTIPEAAQLCLQASSLGQGGEIFVLDMGEQIFVADLARNMIRLSGYVPNQDIKIAYSGLRPGEKLYEELVSKQERIVSTQHPKIRRVTSSTTLTDEEFSSHIKELENLILNGTSDQIIQKLQSLVPGYSTTFQKC